MLAGTGSDVGKTVLVAGLCRLAHQLGLNVRPFKPQNMSNNAAIAQSAGASSGGEIGRGQWLQAFAANTPAVTDMNPVLLKPQAQGKAQIIVQGRVWATASGRDYQHLKRELLPAVCDSFARLRQQADLILVEGAGSVAEINLRRHDIANMGFATTVNAPVVLVGDIDRGGVIASLVGTYHILPEQDRRLISGFIINKFRGDQSLFDTAIAAITAHTGWKNFGIVPWDDAFNMLPAEDSLALAPSQLAAVSRHKSGPGLKIVIPCLSHIANFDDFLPLEREEGVALIWLRQGDEWPEGVDLVILPGSKATIAAMVELENNGWAQAIRSHAARGGAIIGICGGFQMLGKSIADPQAIEGEQRQIAGLGLLDMTTIIHPDKIARKVAAHDRRLKTQIQAYEIHAGISSGVDCDHAPFTVDGHNNGGANATGHIWGTYLHGIFADGSWRAKYLASLGVHSRGQDQDQIMDKALDEIAALLQRNLDCDALFALAR